MLLAFIPSQSPGNPGGFLYQYQDFAVQPDVIYWYWLEDIDFDGRTTLHGPVSAALETPTAVELARLGAGAASPAPLPLAGVLLALIAPLIVGLGWRRA